ncbi:right-handed parallel beta-helix repeat-containing protein [Taibaiella helva]|uniref:right-handed parallel beta-helix repeat-containing protein n=1 Tax=Taibaiella helva TaxID=2301235 RepID=UPI000E586D4E|nr:glycosyl hydrolase family 28-related protein [Taibaiella helva]
MIKSITTLLCLLLASVSIRAQLVVNVKEYGAKGDGVTDDASAFQKAADKASAAGAATISIPAGNYFVSRTINIRLDAGKKIKLSGAGSISAGSKGASTIFTKSLCSIFYINCPAPTMGGSIECNGICLKGNNVPYTTKHPYYNTDNYAYGIVFNNIASVKMTNSYVGSFYGGGIKVGNARQTANPLSNRSAEVSIINNLVANCWGLHFTKSNAGFVDNYGDGIYLDNVINARVMNNRIENNVTVTRSLGRAGIVLEYNTENCLLQGNTIKGYDRNIHVEGDFGGHTINGNKIFGSDLGILIHSYALKRADGRPAAVTISGNQITNAGFTENLQTAWPVRDRALISIHSASGERKASRVIGNVLTYDGRYALKAKTLLQNHEWYVSFENNSYNTVQLNGKARPLIVHDYQLQDLSGEQYNNVQVDFKALSTWGNKLILGQFKGNKISNNAVTNLKLK